MKLAVVRCWKGNLKTRFVGSRAECYDYMRTHKWWSDLIYLNEDGSFGRLSSWVL